MRNLPQRRYVQHVPARQRWQSCSNPPWAPEIGISVERASLNTGWDLTKVLLCASPLILLTNLTQFVWGLHRSQICVLSSGKQRGWALWRVCAFVCTNHLAKGFHPLCSHSRAGETLHSRGKGPGNPAGSESGGTAPTCRHQRQHRAGGLSHHALHWG